MYGAYIEKACAQDSHFIASYALALQGNGYFRRAYDAPQTFDAARVSNLHALWRTTLVQHYALRHFAVRLPASWCPRGKVRVGDMEYC